MCEFCTKHGEGKKWYLQMKNYSDVLLHEELSSTQKDIVKTTTRAKWNNRFLKRFVMPAINGVPRMQNDSQDASPSTNSHKLIFLKLLRILRNISKVRPSEDEIVARRKVEHFGQVLPIEDVEEVIDMVDSITRLPCGCRFTSIGKTDKRYCFGFGMDKMGILGKFPDAASSLEVLGKEEAKKLFREYDEEGLVHSIWTAVTPYVISMCNCDRDCMAYKGYIEKGGPPSFFRAEYVCQVDWDLCTGCKECISQCQFGAQFYSSALAKVYIEPSKCFGCGVCRPACQNDAITLVPSQEHPEVANLWLRS